MVKKKKWNTRNSIVLDLSLFSSMPTVFCEMSCDNYLKQEVWVAIFVWFTAHNE